MCLNTRERREGKRKNETKIKDIMVQAKSGEE